MTLRSAIITGTASININGTVGATTPTTGAFTTVSANALAAINLSNATYSQIISASTMYIDTTANNINIRPSGVAAGIFSSTGLAVTGTVNTSGYAVATLPTGVTGARAYVTNALAPTFGSAVVGGGAVTIPVFYNGANWIVG